MAAKLKMCITLVKSVSCAAEVNKFTAKVQPMNMDLEFFKWKIAILTNIYTIPSMNDIQWALYVTCKDKPTT